ncbi:MAG: hypothetical protein GXO83_04935 [Chlorobi bacterium]|nr:hypothetical protein [Chlorobiota bacterium]
MKKSIILIAATLIVVSGNTKAQEDQTTKDNTPVLSPFEHTLLIDDQTGMIPDKRTFSMTIQHRFGMMDNGISDLFGIYSPGANIRIGLDYTILNRLDIGYGLTKQNMYNDFQIKWAALQQTISGSMPVSVTLYGNMAIDGRNKDQLGIYYDFLNRLSYFSQVIVGRKINDWLTIQVHGSFTHYNIIDKNFDHDRFGVGGSGRIKFSSMSSVFFQFDTPLNIPSMVKNTSDSNLSKPNVGFGYEVSTGYHSFQFYLLNSKGILPQENYMFNLNDFSKGEFMLGFTIIRMWSF